MSGHFARRFRESAICNGNDLGHIVVHSVAAATEPFTHSPFANEYDDCAFAYAYLSGSGSLDGQAFLKTRGGDVKYAAGNPVVLMPVSPYTTEFFRKRVEGGFETPELDPRLRDHLRSTTAVLPEGLRLVA